MEYCAVLPHSTVPADWQSPGPVSYTHLGELPHLARFQFPEQAVAHPLILYRAGPGGNIADVGIVALGRLFLIGVPVALLIDQD